MVNAGNSDFKIDNMYPIVCSLKDAGKRDDQWIVSPGFKIELFYLPDYEIRNNYQPWQGTSDYDTQIRLVDNTEGSTVINRTSYQIYGIGNGVNVFNEVGSCKLYYHDVEITLGTFS
jgi:hypothetical protein